VAAAAAAEHTVIELDLRTIGGSALTADIDVPKHDDASHLADPADDDIPVTYVPARNSIFLAYALALAEVRGARDIFIGVNALDYSGYPDCRPEFIEAFERVAQMATKAGVTAGHHERIRIHTPLISLTKAATIRQGLRLGVDYALTTSCYDPVLDIGGTAGPGADADGRGDAGSWLACGRCDACLLRRKGFTEVGIDDPIPYADSTVRAPAGP
jgi:7-cyano-7-deazaguanine synthase